MTKIHKKDLIFIAGKGMAGSAIKKALIKKGYLNILNPSRDELDLLNFESVYKWFSSKKPNIVVLAAAKVGGILANSTYPADFILENLKIQNNVIEVAWKLGVRRLLFLGSSCIYPKLAEQPIKEEELLSKKLEPTNEWYAIAKITGIKLCSALRKQHGFDAITLMPTNLYGPKDNYHKSNSHVIPALIRRFYEAKKNKEEFVECWGSGKPLREFLHVNDLGKACVFVLENWDPDSTKDDEGNSLSHLNVGTGLDISINELANLIAIKFDYKGKIIWDNSKPDGTPKKLLDVSRINELGWKASIDIEDGLDLVIEDFKREIYNLRES